MRPSGTGRWRVRRISASSMFERLVQRRGPAGDQRRSDERVHQQAERDAVRRRQVQAASAS
jgi:hypothetical protein